MPQSERGFTIIELLLVLLMISIFGSLGLSIHNSVDKMHLLMTANNIQSLIRRAQETAYGEQNTHIVAFYSTLDECVHIQNSKSINEIVMPRKVSMERTNFPDGKLYFRGKLSPSNGGTIILNSKAYQVKITVLPVTGRVRVYPITRK